MVIGIVIAFRLGVEVRRVGIIEGLIRNSVGDKAEIKVKNSEGKKDKSRTPMEIGAGRYEKG